MEFRKPELNRTTASVIIGAIGVVGVSSACGGDSDPVLTPQTRPTSAAPSGAPETTFTSDPSLEQYDCTGEDLAAKVKPGEIIVDGRCYKANPAAPTGAYERPMQSPELSVAAIKTGTALVARCFVEGPESISNSEEASSKRWVMVELGGIVRKPGKEDAETALIPAVWTHGSQAVTQKCPA